MRAAGMTKAMISITALSSTLITIQMDASGVPTPIIVPDGTTTTLTIDTNNHPPEITEPDGGVYCFKYTPGNTETKSIPVCRNY